ncbi:FAD-linked oxidase C-terminal domain-containing protein [Biformimicrobium ophioploci]|uniref:Glycolate oxidase subunit GlcD n=1 Tax=Biformimicrobium ophioploci TaxID=3036711 RepID=A0ABQ6M0W0_9GAMM|nr:FAD-linked oxidase C-terminal domain-containing protein [Microbulbifer sp. NKW57]GMG87920.1 glycolate oxidase subunit GlcD [Microbulbifer sp. NKW57]
MIEQTAPIAESTYRELLSGLQAILADEELVIEPERLRVFECDALTAYRRMPKVAALPRTEGQVQRILKLCDRLQVPVVTRGAGTGLSGGALPHSAGLLLVMSRFDRILEIDPVRMLARVQPGVRNAAVSEAAASHRLFYAPDPSSQIACSIGGNIAENAGGIHCLKYGLTHNNVASIRALTVEGEVLTLGTEALENAGPEYRSMLIGSEGMLAAVTEITLRLLPLPVETRTLLAGFDSVADASAAVKGIIAAGMVPAALEMLDATTVAAVSEYCNCGYPPTAAAVLLADVDGAPAVATADAEQLTGIFRDCGATSVSVATDASERARLWLGRKSAFPALGRITPDYYCIDGSIPRGEIGAVLADIEKLSKDAGILVANVFHAGDGNLHPIILFDAGKAGEIDRVEALAGRILERCIAAGGSITGEHGVGVEKIDQMATQFTDAEIAQFLAVKAALDPNGILNPGKGVPSLRRCQEYRALKKHSEGAA